MATSVKMADQDKRRLDRLQGELMARRGRRVSQQALLSLLLDIAEGARERLLGDPAEPMTDREIAAMGRLSVATGVRTREEEIDGVVTGESK